VSRATSLDRTIDLIRENYPLIKEAEDLAAEHEARAAANDAIGFVDEAEGARRVAGALREHARRARVLLTMRLIADAMGPGGPGEPDSE
jgi:hypothetical protein